MFELPRPTTIPPKSVTQPGLTRFELYMGIRRCREVYGKVKDGEAAVVCSLREIVEDNHSFLALLLLNYYYQGQLHLAINQQQPTKLNIASAYKYIVQHGEIHGTPVYVLRASFCFWCAQYCQIILKDAEQTNSWYQLAIRHLVCADQIKSHSQAAINNAFYVYTEAAPYGASYGKNDFFNLLNLVKEGNAKTLLDEIIRFSGLTVPKITSAQQYGVDDAKKFASQLKSYEQMTSLTSATRLFPPLKAEDRSLGLQSSQRSTSNIALT